MGKQFSLLQQLGTHLMSFHETRSSGQTIQHSAFLTATFFKNKDSVFSSQRLFRNDSHIPCHGAVPCWKTIKRWMNNFKK